MLILIDSKKYVGNQYLVGSENMKRYLQKDKNGAVEIKYIGSDEKSYGVFTPLNFCDIDIFEVIRDLPEGSVISIEVKEWLIR